MNISKCHIIYLIKHVGFELALSVDYKNDFKKLEQEINNKISTFPVNCPANLFKSNRQISRFNISGEELTHPSFLQKWEEWERGKKKKKSNISPKKNQTNQNAEDNCNYEKQKENSDEEGEEEGEEELLNHNLELEELLQEYLENDIIVKSDPPGDDEEECGEEENGEEEEKVNKKVMGTSGTTIGKKKNNNMGKNKRKRMEETDGPGKEIDQSKKKKTKPKKTESKVYTTKKDITKLSNMRSRRIIRETQKLLSSFEYEEEDCKEEDFVIEKKKRKRECDSDWEENANLRLQELREDVQFELDMK
jgi:hypothetical protein